MSIEPTLNLLEGLHYRMAYLMQNLLDDLEKFIHPDNNKEFTIKEIIATYAWHGKHLAHITELKKTQELVIKSDQKKYCKESQTICLAFLQTKI
jgi:hypothetical protein